MIIYKYNIGTQHLIAPFPCMLQWLTDNMVSAKIIAEGLIRSCLYFIKAFAASKLTLILDGNKTKPNMAKTTNPYRSSPNLPFLAFFFILASITFHLNPPSTTLHWLILPKHNKLTTFEVMSLNFCLR